MRKIAVLRWGHRDRDKRLTAHVGLTARALGASSFILADVRDEKVKTTLDKVVEEWGGPFHFEMDKPWEETVRDWKSGGGVVVHLTAYGENIQTSDVLERIKATRRDILVIVGSRKVPSQFFSQEVSDFNVAIGNQPHSECSSLAVFLDRLLGGYGLSKDYEHAKLKIVPQKRGKRVVE